MRSSRLCSARSASSWPHPRPGADRSDFVSRRGDRRTGGPGGGHIERAGDEPPGRLGSGLESLTVRNKRVPRMPGGDERFRQVLWIGVTRSVLGPD
jgi:hypothetical protein